MALLPRICVKDLLDRNTLLKQGRNLPFPFTKLVVPFQQTVENEPFSIWEQKNGTVLDQNNDKLKL